MQVIAPEIGVRIERVDLGSIGEADFPAEVHRIAVAASCLRIDLTRSPLWRFTLIVQSEFDHVSYWSIPPSHRVGSVVCGPPHAGSRHGVQNLSPRPAVYLGHDRPERTGRRSDRLRASIPEQGGGRAPRLLACPFRRQGPRPDPPRPTSDRPASPAIVGCDGPSTPARAS